MTGVFRRVLFRSVQFTVNAFDPTNCVIPAGGFMTLSIAKASTGTVVPKGTFVARIQFV